MTSKVIKSKEFSRQFIKHVSGEKLSKVETLRGKASKVDILIRKVVNSSKPTQKPKATKATQPKSHKSHTEAKKPQKPEATKATEARSHKSHQSHLTTKNNRIPTLKKNK